MHRLPPRRTSLLALSLAAFAGCDSSPPPSAPAPAPVVKAAKKQTPAPAPPSAYALRPQENVWPQLSVQAPTPVSGDLLAANYYVVLDGSGSMKNHGCSGAQSKMVAARSALASFAASVPAKANLGLLVFDATGLSERLPLGLANREQFAAVVDQVTPDGGTPLKAAVATAYERLQAQGRAQLGYGEYHLVIVTDGKASKGQGPSGEVSRILRESPVLFHTIGFCIGNDHSLNQPGRTFYRAANDPEALRKGLDDVLAEAPSFDAASFQD